MYIPNLPKALDFRPLVHLNSHLTLNASGLAGFFGGEEAASAMATVHICSHRKMWGWYNSPGSYQIAKRYGLLTKFGFFFGGGHADPAELLTAFELDGRGKGPLFLRVHSGNIIPQTDHFATVFMRIVRPPKRLTPPHRGGRQPVRVTIAELNHSPQSDAQPRPIRIPHSRTYAIIPIIVSLGACAVCIVAMDWYTLSVILLGIVTNGFSCFAIGSIKLRFWYPRLAAETNEEERSDTIARRVSGIFITPTDIVLLKGREDAAMAVAQGRLELTGSERVHLLIAICTLLLVVQLFVQVILVAQGSLVGQIAFVVSLAVSWSYNLWLCSIDKVEVQQQILQENLLKFEESEVQRYWLDSWPAMVTFVLLALVLEDDDVEDPASELKFVLDALVEDTTGIWTIWKPAILDRLSELKESKDLDKFASELDISHEARAGIKAYRERNHSECS